MVRSNYVCILDISIDLLEVISQTCREYKKCKAIVCDKLKLMRNGCTVLCLVSSLWHAGFKSWLANEISILPDHYAEVSSDSNISRCSLEVFNTLY